MLERHEGQVFIIPYSFTLMNGRSDVMVTVECELGKSPRMPNSISASEYLYSPRAAGAVLS